MGTTNLNKTRQRFGYRKVNAFLGTRLQKQHIHKIKKDYTTGMQTANLTAAF